MIGIIGGTGVYEIVEHGRVERQESISTPYGETPEISIFKLHRQMVAFIPRHSPGHDNPPHRVNYRANVWALKELGVRHIIATNAVGSLKRSIGPGDFVVPEDFLDFTRSRPSTFYDEKTVHVDMTEPYCRNLRSALTGYPGVIDGGVYVCTEGPRFETPAEIRMFRALGGTVVGMTGLPEAVLARELEMCYASLCLVSNYAASISSSKLTITEVLEIMDEKKHELIDIIDAAIRDLKMEQPCPCPDALRGADINDG
ncbi:S-methyl-5'-thioadenosine phosphorylase [Methanothermobacter thermautotrophicus]|jgi:5'-methylthioadenosine phosphorylase|uniref:Probable S-methyl-5'-thioinosine phosphorylase n=1 Tax=Methanothermobacter thermautotrophicus TaxID=145262 RepID=A0A842YK12_METTF|nr:S-methyl-5'-thioadenosine phosphorylase [Methanothermobacter thermautotrophicus]MBE2899842.1 S-methyl-5'-thioadenosine phosphorylase [Methanothermobacter thermautotrophicus]MCQ8904908.1 S-methyl-5'-thioadenosine phosphorylase [Methanothermobacter sp.]